MSNCKDLNRIRLKLDFMESPKLPNISDTEVTHSPVSDLAINLNDTSLESTPRRKLLQCNDDTPTSSRLKKVQFDLNDAVVEPQYVENRLLKNVIKFPGSSGLPRSRGFIRRINMSPILGGTPQRNNKENENAMSPVVEEPTPTAFQSPSKHSPSKFSSPLRMRQPLEDHDPNSQDCMYNLNHADRDDKTGFRFTEPTTFSLKKSSDSPSKDSLSPSSQSLSSGFSSSSPFRSLSFGSINTDSTDDGFVDVFDIEKQNEDSFPLGIGSLLSASLKGPAPKKESNQEGRPRMIRRHFSLTETSTRVQHNLFTISPSKNEKEDEQTSSDSIRVFKRPDPPAELSSLMHCLKRPKINSLYYPENNQPSINQVDMKTSVPENFPNPRLQRSLSESEATIKRALQRSSMEPDLIGDFSKPFILPLIEGRHQDLKTISSETLAKVIEGEYDTLVDSYLIVDCRYPYEYEGGHIKGAINMYTQEQILKEFVEIHKTKPKETPATSQRHILIFHCEFSSERGPKLTRFLRNSDRVLNKEFYPALHYPEVYLLHGGYKEFFERHSGLCEPCSYRPMLDPKHEADLRHFRAKSKSGSGTDCKSRLAMRSSLKRLGL